MACASVKSQLSDPFWFVVPAAGVGARMGMENPKQYLQLNQQTIIEHTLTKLTAFENSRGIVVAIADNDPYWSELSCAKQSQVQTVVGGAERYESVLNALEAIKTQASDNDWVLVHDVARPCIRLSLIQSLMRELDGHEVGGLLALPVSDTIKRVADDQAVQQTVDRRYLWQAQTPQMFRFGLLYHSLQQALADGRVVTDESSALEYAGYQPRVVEGSAENVKITRAEDLPLAAFYLQQQESCA